MDAVPNLCTVKSPMAIAGSLIKHDAHKPTDAMSRYHLEGTLDSLLNNGDDARSRAWETFNQQQEALVPDVDLVITTHELCTVLHDAAAATGTESDLHQASYEPLPWKKVGNSTKGIASRRTRSRVKTSGDAKAVADSSEMMMSKTATGEMKMNGYHYAHLRIPNVFIQHETER
eukprot:scaffold3797_cov267-Chaetoceros_neogracile.AAC.8